MANALFYGDNLLVPRDSITSESVDLIYLDTPFNSQATYNVLFKSPRPRGSLRIRERCMASVSMEVIKLY